jgi:hypothetical protein
MEEADIDVVDRHAAEFGIADETAQRGTVGFGAYMRCQQYLLAPSGDDSADLAAPGAVEHTARVVDQRDALLDGEPDERGRRARVDPVVRPDEGAAPQADPRDAGPGQTWQCHIHVARFPQVFTLPLILTAIVRVTS